MANRLDREAVQVSMNEHCAIVRIVRGDGFVSALGHRVALHLGGEPELKRRVLGTLAQLDCPPDEIRFERRSLSEAPGAAAEEPPAPPEEPTLVSPPPAPEPPREPPRKGGKGQSKR